MARAPLSARFFEPLWKVAVKSTQPPVQSLGGLLAGVKRMGRDLDLLLSSRADIKGRVEVHLCAFMSSSGMKSIMGYEKI